MCCPFGREVLRVIGDAIRDRSEDFLDGTQVVEHEKNLVVDESFGTPFPPNYFFDSAFTM